MITANLLIKCNFSISITFAMPSQYYLRENLGLSGNDTDTDKGVWKEKEYMHLPTSTGRASHGEGRDSQWSKAFSSCSLFCIHDRGGATPPTCTSCAAGKTRIGGHRSLWVIPPQTIPKAHHSNTQKAMSVQSYSQKSWPTIYTKNEQINCSHSTIIALSAHWPCTWSGVVLSGFARWSVGVQELFSPIPNWY